MPEQTKYHPDALGDAIYEVLHSSADADPEAGSEKDRRHVGVLLWATGPADEPEVSAVFVAPRRKSTPELMDGAPDVPTLYVPGSLIWDADGDIPPENSNAVAKMLSDFYGGPPPDSE